MMLMPDLKKKVQTDDTTAGAIDVLDDGCTGSDSDGPVQTEPSDKSDSSRLTSSRSCSTRSSGRKKKHLEKLMEYNRGKAADKGEEFVEDATAHRQWKYNKMMVPVDESVPSGSIKLSGSMASSLNAEQIAGHLKSLADSKKISLEDIMQFKGNVDRFLAPKYTPKADPASLALVNSRYVRTTLLCQKAANWGT